jgi:N-acetylglucosaminyldiphosphoundecaprenol N-acetyl-beta-D-mannosaminyltransferase
MPGAEIDVWLTRALRDPWDEHCREIITLNPEYVMAARREPAFAGAIVQAELVTADGAGVAVAARLIHGTRVGRVTGVDLVERLAALSGELTAPLYLLGAAPGVAAAAGAKLAEQYPGVRLAGAWGGGTPDPAHDEETLGRIARSGARMVAVAYGAPAQVVWIERNRAALARAGVRLAIGVGGALDYLSGAVWRPPRLVRRLGLEWLLRLLIEPRRWRRQTVLPVFAVKVLAAALGERWDRVRRTCP